MNKEIINLGIILRSIDNFSMSTFDGRLRVQKSIYLLQSFGVYIGYNFSWYLRGPYCTKLASDGFALQENFQSFPKVRGRFKNKVTQNKFENFLDFMKNKKNDADKLEILASIHFLKKLYQKMTEHEILEKVKKKQIYFTPKQCKSAWNELKKEKLI